MRQSITNRRALRALCALCLLCALCALCACEKQIAPDTQEDGNVVLQFHPSTRDLSTRATVAIGDYFAKLNIMLFDEDGQRVWEKVRTQLRTDEQFGRLTCALSPGTYTVVAVGHSSATSATIKSPEMVQFTASDGEKLTDTFSYCGELVVGDDTQQHDLLMLRVGAMIQFSLTDTTTPDNFSRLKIDYTGGSANFNPTTSEGCTKSTQSEQRTATPAQLYQCFTFPYQAETCLLKMTLSAFDADGNIIRQRVFTDVPVTRNRITVYTGHFFEPGDGEFTQTGFGFSVNPDWDGTDEYEF